MTNTVCGTVVLVPEAQTVGALAVIRSLGRAGFKVIACSHHPDAIGFLSCYAHRFLASPTYSDVERYCCWLSDLVLRESIAAIVPSEGFLLAIRHRYAEFSHLLPVARDPEVVYAGMSKADLFEHFLTPAADAQLRANLPPSVVLGPDSVFPSDEQLAKLGIPLYLKVDACHALKGGGGRVVRISEARGVRRQCIELLADYRKVVVQGHVPGRGVGVFLLRWNRRVIGKYMHRRIHEVPHTGGVSSLRETWWHEAIAEDALARASSLDWEGPAMFEYRWDAQDDRFYLMEMNGRFWGSLHLALHAGADFPRVAVEAMLGKEVVCGSAALGVQCRFTFPKDLQYVLSCLRDRDLPLQRRIWTMIEFFVNSFDPRVKSDMWFAGDIRPYFSMLRRTLTLLTS